MINEEKNRQINLKLYSTPTLKYNFGILEDMGANTLLIFSCSLLLLTFYLQLQPVTRAGLSLPRLRPLWTPSAGLTYSVGLLPWQLQLLQPISCNISLRVLTPWPAEMFVCFKLVDLTFWDAIIVVIVLSCAQGATALFDMIEYYESATHLNISFNKHIGSRGWQAAAHMMRKVRGRPHLQWEHGQNERGFHGFTKRTKNV